MARRLARLLIVASLALGTVEGWSARPANAAASEDSLPAKDRARAKEALRLYKQGDYEEAAKLFAALSVDYPDRPIFERDAGACFYYLKRPEPALSNLHNYLNHNKEITKDDKDVVDRWIREMEELRAQAKSELAPVAEPVAAPGLDLSARAPASQEAPAPYYKRWWVWAGAAAVAAGAVTAVFLVTRPSESNVPQTALGNQRAY